MPDYYRLRKKWRVWCAWLRYIDEKYKFETPGLNEEVMRRRDLSRMFHRTLQRLLPMQAFQGGSAIYIEDTTARSGLFSLDGSFSRWVEFTQVSICRRRMLRLMQLLRELRIKRVVFMSLRIGIRSAKFTRAEATALQFSLSFASTLGSKHARRAKLEGAATDAEERRLYHDSAGAPSTMRHHLDNTTGALAELADVLDMDGIESDAQDTDEEYYGFDMDSATSSNVTTASTSTQLARYAHMVAQSAGTGLLPQDSFYSRRLRADLDKWRVKFLASYHRAKTYIYRRKRAAMSRQMHIQVHHNMPIMKRLLADQRQDITRRVKHEQKLLCNAFRDRSKERWDDFSAQPPIRKFGTGEGDMIKSDDLDATENNAHADVAVFGDPAQQFVEESFAKEAVLASLIIFSDNEGVHGLARNIGIPYAGEEVGEIHGRAFGDRDVFEVDDDDVLECVEGFVSMAGITRLRLRTLKGKESRWYGVRPPARPGQYFELSAQAETVKFDNVGRGSASDTSAPNVGDGRNNNPFESTFETGTPISRPNSAMSNQSMTSRTSTSSNAGRSKFTSKYAVTDVVNAPRIIGFCGRKSKTRLLNLGILVRRRLAPNVFGRCWEQKGAMTEKHLTEAMQKAENDFAIVLRMRGSYVMDLLRRTQNIAKIMRATRTGAPEAIGHVGIAFHFSKWMFEALTFGLVQVPTASEEKRANEYMTRGMGLMQQGNEKVRKAFEILKGLEQYSTSLGKITLDPAVLGAQMVMELSGKQTKAQFLKAEGQVLRAEAQKLIRESDMLLPGEPPNRKSLRLHFEGLVKLAQTVNSFDKDEYESAL
jgi:hypothetical protein